MEEMPEWIEDLGSVVAYVSDDDYEDFISIENEFCSVDNIWGTLKERYRSFISLYVKKMRKPVAFIFAHGATGYHNGEGFWHIIDGEEKYNLYDWMKERESMFSAFICVSCNAAHIELPRLKKALVIIADDIVSIGGIADTPKWDIIHPQYGGMDYLIEWASEQLKKELQKRQKEGKK